MRKLLRKHGRAPRVLITDKLKSYAAANRDLGLKVEHRQHSALNKRAENSHQPTPAAREGDAPLQISGSPATFRFGP
jgi:transposase-like protein